MKDLQTVNTFDDLDYSKINKLVRTRNGSHVPHWSATVPHDDVQSDHDLFFWLCKGEDVEAAWFVENPSLPDYLCESLLLGDEDEKLAVLAHTYTAAFFTKNLAGYWFELEGFGGDVHDAIHAVLTYLNGKYASKHEIGQVQEEKTYDVFVRKNITFRHRVTAVSAQAADDYVEECHTDADADDEVFNEASGPVEINLVEATD